MLTLARLIEGIFMAELASFEQYVFVDDIAEVAEARQAERQQAESILENRRWRQQVGLEPMQAPVNPLSTARRIREAPAANEPELQKGLLLDCQRLVAEWYRKKRPEYFPPVRHIFDEDMQEFFSHGMSIRQMTENALLPIRDNAEEEQRRINERVEDATPQIMRGLGAVAIGSQAIRTISECSDTAITAYEQDQARGNDYQGYFGYVPEIKKLMIRDIRPDANSSDRHEEQIGLPGIYITHEIVQMTLERRGLLSAAHMDKTELHGSQILVTDDLMTFARELDTVASEQWCTNIFMGEEVVTDHPKNYDSFRQEALERQAGLTDFAQEVATFVTFLEADGADEVQAMVLVEDFVKLKLCELAKEDTQLAAQMFGEKTVQKLQTVNRLEAQGRFDEADLLFNEAVRSAEGGGFCGAGSCGLEGVNPNSSDGQRLKDKLDAKNGDTITKDKVRSCKNCGEKKLYYAHNAVKVNTYCDGCGSSKKTASSAPAKQRSDFTLAA